jgi:hypothetical protein
MSTLTFLLVMSLVQAPPLPEQEFQDKYFKIMAFGKPTNVEKKELQYGQAAEQVIPTTLTKWTMQRGAVASVSEAIFPESFQNVEAKKILDGVRDGLRGPQSLGTEIKSEQDVKVGTEKLAGREIILASKKTWVRVHIFIHNGKLYQLMLNGSEEQVKSEAATAFLKSFKPIQP